MKIKRKRFSTLISLAALVLVLFGTTASAEERFTLGDTEGKCEATVPGTGDKSDPVKLCKCSAKGDDISCQETDDQAICVDFEAGKVTTCWIETITTPSCRCKTEDTPPAP